jgi:hypothetical protein
LEARVHDGNEQQAAPGEPGHREEKKDPSGLRTGWGRPLVIIAILAVILIAIRLIVMLFTM